MFLKRKHVLVEVAVEVKDVNGNIYRGTLIAIQHENLNVTLKEVDISGKEKAPLVLIRGNRVHHIKLIK